MTITKLKLEIVQSHQNQFELAQKVGISETRMSRIVQGRLLPTTYERVALAEALGVAVSDLFDDGGES